MNEEWIVKAWLLPVWIVVLVVVLVLGLPLAHTVSSMDTVLFNVKEQAIQGTNESDLFQLANQEVGGNLPTQFDGKTLFNASDDMVVTNDPVTDEGKVTIVYNFPIFAPFVNLIGLAGPTISIPFTATYTPSSNDEGEVPYTQ